MKIFNLNKFKAVLLTLSFVLLVSQATLAQTAWYIDGYHGGIWGHYPDWNTAFMADMLVKNPDWKINIEIEPETWDRALKVDPEGYQKFKRLFEDQSVNGRIEYVNPAYGQSYMYNISGESIIRQFSYGIKTLRRHFPNAVFTTYSSEEPCFTSALPQILRSFGFEYASLKNPNTCFGGYTAAHAGELVNWTGPDGTSILTSPRYSFESFASKSTWQTIAWNNSPVYISAAYASGIKHPVGMTLQDAGWKGGPFLQDGHHGTVNSIYTTWRNYFNHVAKNDPVDNWKLSQEDIQVSLVWGSQVTQQIAQRVRAAENKIIQTEKIAAMAKFFTGTGWPQKSFDAAWRTLLLSQHHDCWIVPYNGKPGDTWADKVAAWTAFTQGASDSIANAALTNLYNKHGKGDYITVLNTSAIKRTEAVTINLPDQWSGKRISITDTKGTPVLSQLIKGLTDRPDKIMFTANVPALGFRSYHIELQKQENTSAGASVKTLANGNYLLETDEYLIELDADHGGIIKSLIAKRLGNKQFADQHNRFKFNELRGNFYNDGGFKSVTKQPVKVQVLESGPVSIKLVMKGTIAGSPYTQMITLKQGEPRIDFQLGIDWQGNPGIGNPTSAGTYKWELPEKPFYNDSTKLLALFPVNLTHQKIYKNAPFDVVESKLDDTFFNRWDSIKNNVILNWVDVTDGEGKYGLTLLSDHTTSYTHGKDFPLGLDIQYSGMGLWGRNYSINGPTTVNYALIPHAGTWDRAGTWAASTQWNEPLTAVLTNHAITPRSLMKLNGDPIEISSITYEGDDMLVRLFNASKRPGKISLKLDGRAVKAGLVHLNGSLLKALPISNQSGKSLVEVDVPAFGIRTIKVSGMKPLSEKIN